jgi:hypothetical protein
MARNPIMKARTQIIMEPEMQRRAQAKAADLGISFAEYMRRLVANDLGEPKPNISRVASFDDDLRLIALDEIAIAHSKFCAENSSRKN